MLNKIRKSKKKIKKTIITKFSEDKKLFYSDDFIEIVEYLKKIITKKIIKNKYLEKELSDFSSSYLIYLYFLKKTIDFYNESSQIINMVGNSCGKKNDIFYENMLIFLDYSINVYEINISDTNWLKKNIVSYDLKDIENYQKLSKKNKNYINHFSYHPRYALLLNHNLKIIIITIRGTKTAIDAIADINCENIKKFDGYIHEGFYNSAISLFKKIENDLLKILNEYPDYKLSLCGHSLGGSVATVLSIIIKQNIKFINKTEVWAYGPAPIFTSPDKIQKYGIEINTIINQSDLIPRLSMYNIFYFLDKLIRVRYFVEKESLSFYKMMYNLKMKKYNNETIFLLKNIFEILQDTNYFKIEEKQLYLMGNIYLITSKLKTKKIALRKLKYYDVANPILYAGKDSIINHSSLIYKESINSLDI